MPTFAEAAERVWTQLQPGWRHSKHRRDWLTSLTRYAFPSLGKQPVSEITSADVLDTLRPIWHTQPDMARRVRQRIRAVMEQAIVMQYRADNPCDRIGPALGRQQVIVQHMRALPHAQVAEVQRARTMRVVKLAFEFLVLTAARTGEVRFATWDEIDRDGRVWTILRPRA